MSAANPKKFVTVLKPKYFYAKSKKNADHLRAEALALRWMGDQTHLPAAKDKTVLDGGARLGGFWAGCKSLKRCANPPYSRLLANPVLRADYRYSGGTG